MGSWGLLFFGLFYNRCGWPLNCSSSCWIDMCLDKPSLHMRGFPTTIFLLIPHSFPIGFPWSPDQTVLYHPTLIDVPYSVECWVLYLRACAFIQSGAHSKTTGSGFSSGIHILLRRSGQPFPFWIGKAIRHLVVSCLGSIRRLTQIEGWFQNTRYLDFGILGIPISEYSVSQLLNTRFPNYWILGIPISKYPVSRFWTTRYPHFVILGIPISKHSVYRFWNTRYPDNRSPWFFCSWLTHSAHLR